MTTALPEPLRLVTEIIQEKIEISPESDRVLILSLWDFRNKNGDLIPKDDLKRILRLLEEKKLLQIIDTSCLDKLGRFQGETVTVKIDREYFNNLGGKVVAAQTGNELTWKDLKVDLTKGILQYRNNKPIEITSEQDEIRFLVLLMREDKILEYKEIAKQLEMNCYHEGVINSDIAREVNFLKRNLATVLKRAGMRKNDIATMILTKRKVGYKLQR